MTTKNQKTLRKQILKWLIKNYKDKFNIDFTNIFLLENMENNQDNKYNTCIYRFNPAFDQDTINITKDLIIKLLDSYGINYIFYTIQDLYEKKHILLRISNCELALSLLKLL